MSCFDAKYPVIAIKDIFRAKYLSYFCMTFAKPSQFCVISSLILKQTQSIRLTADSFLVSHLSSTIFIRRRLLSHNSYLLSVLTEVSPTSGHTRVPLAKAISMHSDTRRPNNCSKSLMLIVIPLRPHCLCSGTPHRSVARPTGG